MKVGTFVAFEDVGAKFISSVDGCKLDNGLITYTVDSCSSVECKNAFVV